MSYIKLKTNTIKNFAQFNLCASCLIRQKKTVIRKEKPKSQKRKTANFFLQKNKLFCAKKQHFQQK